MAKNPDRIWTVMLYLACDNNLSAAGIDALKELKRLQIGPLESVTVIAQFDPFSGVETKPTCPNGIPAQRYILKYSTEDWTLFHDIDCVISETNTASSGGLSDFLNWGIEEFPAEHYMIVLSGHGAGVEPGFLLKDETIELNDPEDVVRNYLQIRELRGIFTAVKARINQKVDIVGFDNCLMSMVEIAHELKDSVRYLVASEGFDPNGGWPFFRMIDPLVQNPGHNLRALCGAIVQKYTLYYGDFMLGGISVDLAVIDLNQTNNLTSAIKNLSDVLVSALNGRNRTSVAEHLVLAHWQAQSYNGERFADLFDFCQLLQGRGPGRAIEQACAGVKTAVDNMVVLSCFVGSVFQFSYGLSIYFPWSDVDEYYEKLRFATSSRWLNFVRAYIVKTRRAPRSIYRVKSGSPKIFSPIFEQKLPPDDRGPIGNVQSMRNPPRNFPASKCLPWNRRP